MGKVTRIRGDLDDVEALLEILHILKDVSTNKFFAFAQQKQEFSKFLEIFLIFFNMLEGVYTECPLVRNDNPRVDIVVVTSEASFMSVFNSRVCNAAVKEYRKHPESRIIAVGKKAISKMQAAGMKVEKTYTGVEEEGRYVTSMRIRDYVIEGIMSGRVGRCICIYAWPKSFSILKPRVVKLLPATELLGGEDFAFASEGRRRRMKGRGAFIQESSIDGIMKVLADIWVSSRIFEILTDTRLAEAAAQAQQLESAVESLSAEKKGLMVGLRKASRDELNQAMREVFTASTLVRRR